MSKIRVQTVLQSHAIMAAMAGDPKEGVLTSAVYCHTKGDKVEGQCLDARRCCPVSLICPVPVALACTWFALLRDSQAHTSGDRRTAALT